MIIADENVDHSIIAELRKKGHKVISIAESYSGFNDEDVIGVVKTYEGLLITEDKDFGEWVFAHGAKGFSVILLRYATNDVEVITKNILITVGKIEKKQHKFVTITRNKQEPGIFNYLLPVRTGTGGLTTNIFQKNNQLANS